MKPRHPHALPVQSTEGTLLRLSRLSPRKKLNLHKTLPGRPLLFAGSVKAV